MTADHETTTAGVLRSAAHHMETSRTTAAEALRVATVRDDPMHRVVAVNAFWSATGGTLADYQADHGVDGTVAKLREVADRMEGN